MAITSPRAKKLTTATEFSLFEESLGRNVGGLTPAQLKKKATQARRLRDKYRSLAERQEREARGKAQARGRRPAQGSAATRDKQRLFQETLDRFEARLATVDEGDAAGTPPPASDREATAAKKARGRKGGAKARGASASKAPKKVGRKKVGRKKGGAKKAAPRKAGPGKAASKKGTSAPADAAPAAGPGATKTPATRRKARASDDAFGAWTRTGTGAARKRKPTQKARKAAGPTATHTKGAVERSRLRQTGAVKVQKHVAARGRRAQAKRDSRGR